MHRPVSMATSVATGIKVYAIMATEIKDVSSHNLVCKADQWEWFTLRYSGCLYLLKYNWNATTENYLI